jgi:RNA polymerase sigma-70 factor (ECF subfamily)
MGDGRIYQSRKRQHDLRVVPGGAGEFDETRAPEAADSPEALEQLFAAYAPRIYNYILKRVGRVEDAEDLTSVVFEKVVLNVHAFDGRKASFSTWIYRIATNCLTDFYRSRARRRETYLEDERPSEQVGGSDIERIDLYVVLLDLLDRLPARYREAVALRYFGGLRVQEVASALKITESAASKRILRGLDELRRLAEGGPLKELL